MTLPVPSISIALATHNGERYLRQQLESLAGQTVLPCELVASDDLSSDRTLAILDSFAASSPFPVLIHKNSERKGYAGNFLQAASLCRGDVIAFCDQDDVWRADKLARCAAEFQRTEIGLVIHSAQEVDEELNPCSRFLPDLRRSEVLATGTTHPHVDCPPGCAMLIRRTIMQEVMRLWPQDCLGDGPRPRVRYLLAHDCAAYYVARSLAAVSYIAEPLIYHRRHSSNITGPRLGLRQYLNMLVQTGPPAYLRLAEHAGAASELYDYMATRARERDLERSLRQVASRFRRRAAGLMSRAELYSMGPRLARLRAMATMTRTGVYARVSRGGVGHKAMGKDLLWALFARSGSAS